jgi:hypothetical protein
MISSQDGRSTAFIHSQDGVTQGDALVMAAYGMGLFLLILRLKKEFPMVWQPSWYADDTRVKRAHLALITRTTLGACPDIEHHLLEYLAV